MTSRYSKEKVIMTVTRLTRAQLDRYIAMQLVEPERSEGEPVFCDVDIARLELLCDLSEDLDLDETAMGIVLSLLDQLHEARRDLVQLAEVIESLPEDLRGRIDSALRRG
jgi:chaperone modulatory protein CbpM